MNGSTEGIAWLTALARKAGAAALDHYHPDVAVERKQDSSPVTAADRAAHAVIMRGLAAWDPTIPIVSEEGDIPGPEVRDQWDRFWLVDPLDGTKEFLQRNGEFTVNIALIERGDPVLGVIFAPALDLLYFAGNGLGAWKSEGGAAPVRVYSKPAAPGAPLVVAESRSHPSAALEEYLKTLPIARRVQAGSSLKFCWVAEGKADIYPRLGPTMEWDVAAGDCIFRNSGRGGLRRSPLKYNQPELRNEGFVVGLDDQGATVNGVAAAPLKPAVLWFTGLSGAGKSTIAGRVAAELRRRGCRVEELDGDAIRDIFPATGFTRPERDAHIRRVGYLASRLEHHGVFVIAALVSPYLESRNFVRGLCRNFVEIYVATSFEECERRDVKGLYAKARRGEIKHFTGMDDPYEPPVNPELTIETRGRTPEAAAEDVLRWLERQAAGAGPK
ncbi:MAG TPA: 3'(2'),5'-bisphosphate nucleotidase CysQ [Gemmatimonadales bacterium]|nr:3'(2'),5'-bisphosphate nucleotidase CysQ [Gemmatimonadales bacterium]